MNGTATMGGTGGFLGSCWLVSVGFGFGLVLVLVWV